MTSLKQVLLLFSIFLLGLISASIFSLETDGQKPLSFIVPTGASPEVDSPQDWINEEQIRVYDDRVIIFIKDPEWARFTDTNSMDPVFDYGSNAIEIVPKSPEHVKAGDIVSYKSRYASGTIVHRIVEIGEDEEGWYAVVKGDNNPSNDPGKVRFSQIQRLVVGIIY